MKLPGALHEDVVGAEGQAAHTSLPLQLAVYDEPFAVHVCVEPPGLAGRDDEWAVRLAFGLHRTPHQLALAPLPLSIRSNGHLSCGGSICSRLRTIDAVGSLWIGGSGVAAMSCRIVDNERAACDVPVAVPCSPADAEHSIHLDRDHRVGVVQQRWQPHVVDVPEPLRRHWNRTVPDAGL